ncbi:hypothetical protein, partial [Geobacillus subterraneus]|uniref:hypothetical protein n=1 Tax=Geobacillus subterraneus TaxID=129338 RepID=UPI001C8833DC
MTKKDDDDNQIKQHFSLFIPYISLDNIVIMFAFKSRVHLLVMNPILNDYEKNGILSSLEGGESMPTITLKLELHNPTNVKQDMYERMTEV